MATSLRTMSISNCESKVFSLADCRLPIGCCSVVTTTPNRVRLHRPSNWQLAIANRQLLDCDLVERRDRRRLGSRVAGRQQMKLRHLVRQISNPEQLVPDFRRAVNLLASLVECFDAVANSGQRFRDVG